MKIDKTYQSLIVLILCCIGFFLYKFIVFPKLETDRKKSYLIESFEGVVSGEYFDKHRRGHKYLILQDGSFLDIKNRYYLYEIKIGQYIKKESGDSIIYINQTKYNYLKE